ncbi:MAG: AsmA-like C-terminal region-containing protein [Elusimicrobiota bacterium]
MKPSHAALRVFAIVAHALLRGLSFVFLVAVLLAVVIGGYAYRRFSPETARLLAIKQLTSFLNREVTIQRLVLTPRGLKIRGLRVRRGRAGENDDLLACDSALLTVKLRPLLRRRLEFDTVLLQSPQISLLRDAQGAWDLADVFGSSATARRGALPLAATEMVVSDGVLRVDDRLNGRKAVFEQLSLRVDGFDEVKPFPVEVSFVSAVSFAARTVTTSVSASGSVDLAGLQWPNATVRATRLKALVDGLEVTGSASILGFSAMRVEADLSVASLGPDRWRRLTGTEDSPLSLPATRWRVKASIPVPGMLELERLAIETPAGTVSATGIVDFAGPASNLSVELAARDFALDKASSWHPAWARRSLSGQATLRVSLTGWPGRLQAREAELALRGFASSWGERRLEGVDLDATAAEEFTKVKVAVSKGKASGFGAVFEDISAGLSVEKQNMVVERLVFLWGGSRVKIRARVEHLAAPKEVVLSGTVDKLKWEDAQRLVTAIAASVSTRTRTSDESRPWVRTFKYAIPRGLPDTVGRVRVGELTQANFWCKDLDLLWSLRGVTQNLDKAGGSARLRFGPGRVSDVATMQDSHKILRVIFLPYVFMQKMNQMSVFSAATAYPKTLDFNLIEGEYAVSKGVAETRYFHVDSAQLVAYADGTADFGREKVDMNILTRLTGYRGTLPEWWVDEAGRPAIGFRVKGDLSRPELEPRFKKIGEGEIGRMVDEGRARAKKRFEELEKLQAL